MPQDNSGYDVYLFPPAIEALGDAIKPFLRDGSSGQHLPCRDVDTSGSLIELTIDAPSADGAAGQIEVMFPSNMVRLIISAHAGDVAFGFGRRQATKASAAAPTLEPGLAPKQEG